MHVAKASERERSRVFNLGLSLTFGPHADIVQKTTSRRTVEMVVKQLVSLETTETLFFFSLPLPPLLYRTFLRCSAFFRGPFIDCPSFFLVLYSCVTLLLLFYSKYVQLIARVCFFVLAGLHLVGRFDCLLWRRSRPSKLLYFYFSPCERLVQAFPFFRTCAQAWVWVVLFFFFNGMHITQPFSFCTKYVGCRQHWSLCIGRMRCETKIRLVIFVAATEMRCKTARVTVLCFCSKLFFIA